MGASDVVEQLTKILPVERVYNDALSPAMKQLGYTLEDVTKCLRIATFPLQVGAAAQDQLARFLKAAVEKVPEERRVLPSPQILGPVVEAVRYEPAGGDVGDMFAELLSRSMDSERLSEAHPAFPMIIKQLSRDEAVIVRTLKMRMIGKEGTFKRTIRYGLKGGRFNFEAVEADDFPTDNLLFPSNLDLYFNHLWYLGLAGVFDYKNPEPIMRDGTQIGSRVKTH